MHGDTAREVLWNARMKELFQVAVRFKVYSDKFIVPAKEVDDSAIR